MSPKWISKCLLIVNVLPISIWFLGRYHAVSIGSAFPSPCLNFDDLAQCEPQITAVVLVHQFVTQTFAFSKFVHSSFPGVNFAMKPIMTQGPTIKYVTLFWTNFDPPSPVTLCHTSWDPPKVRHTSRTPKFLVVHTHVHIIIHVCLSSWRFLTGGFCPEVSCLEGLSGVVFCQSPFSQNTSITTES